MNQSVNFLGRTLSGPIITAPCPAAWSANDLIELMQSGAGAVTTKSVTKDHRKGNAEPREYYWNESSINAVGLANDGIAAHVEYIKTAVAAVPNVPVIISIAGFGTEEYVDCVVAASQSPEIFAIELNLSCPNTEHNIIADDPKLVGAVLSAVCKHNQKPLGIKVNPTNSQQLADAIVAVADSHGVDFITCTNTVGGAYLAQADGAPVLAANGGFGGLAGASISAISIGTLVRYKSAIERQKSDIEIISVGGVTTGAEAQKRLHLGASVVGIATPIMIHGAVVVGQINAEMNVKG